MAFTRDLAFVVKLLVLTSTEPRLWQLLLVVDILLPIRGLHVFTILFVDRSTELMLTGVTIESKLV